jgi:L-lactate utilization protein LutB
MDFQKIVRALEANNMKVYLVKNRHDACSLTLSLIDKKDIVGSGGSLTLDQCGIREALRSKGYHFLDWHKPGIDPAEKHKLLVQSLSSDVFLTSSNAITEDGKLYNVDGRGNRVAAMIFGPKKVILVAGRNKIVKNLQEAKERLETIAAPLNAVKNKKKTGCIETGYCIDCHTPDRICCHTVVSEFQSLKRFHIILVDEDLGL